MLETKFLEIVLPDGSSDDLNSELKQYTLFGWEPNVSAKQRIRVSNAIRIGNVNLKDSEYGDEYTVTLKRDTQMTNYQLILNFEQEYSHLTAEMTDLTSKYYETPKVHKASSGIPMWAKVAVSVFLFPFGLLIFLIKDPTPEQVQNDNNLNFENEQKRLDSAYDIEQSKLDDEQRKQFLSSRLEEIARECRKL